MQAAMTAITKNMQSADQVAPHQYDSDYTISERMFTGNRCQIR
jgi:hypothetical protein